MKKLMLTAAIVCAAVMSQGATWSWAANADEIDTDYAKVSDGGYMIGGLASYIFDAGAVTKTDIISMFANKNSDVEALALKPFAMDDYGMVSQSGTGLSGEANADVYAFMVIVDSTTFAGGEKFFVSENAKANINSLVQAGNPAGFAFGTVVANTGSWTAMAPEPTSGLLLLLGMGALALRRRRA